MAEYFRPTDIEEALTALDAAPRTIVAGGTDFYPGRVGRPLDDDVVDVTGLSDLRRIEDTGDGWRIGALVTWSDLIRSALPPLFDGLKAAGREVGGIQVQNAGTIAGNICNASPAADGMPNLMALDSVVELSSVAGSRTVPISEFVIGNRKTMRRTNELLTGIIVPRPANPARSVFLKLGARRYLVISIVMVAGIIEIAPDGAVTNPRISVGACSEVARRLPQLEAELAGQPVGPALSNVVTADHLAGLSPISDVRGTADYRGDAALTLVRRALAELGGK